MTQPLEYLELAITKQIPLTWQPAYLEEHTENFVKDETLGILISKYVRWDCERLLTVIKSALEDSNYHSLIEAIDEFVTNEDNTED